MAKARTFQDFQDESYNERFYGHTFEQVCKDTPDPVFDNHARRLDVIDRIVNNSCEGSLSDDEARQQAELLFSMRETMTHSEFYAAQQMLDVSFQNNLRNGVANDFYDEWTRDERRNG